MSELTEQFREAVKENYGEVSHIESRECSSDMFEGTEYTFCGEFVPIRPLLDVVQNEGDVAVEEMSLGYSSNGDGDRALRIFVAETEPVSHPAFV